MRTRLTVLLLGAALALGACGSSDSPKKAEGTTSTAAEARAGHAGKGAGAAKQAHGGPAASAGTAGGNASLYRSSSGNPEERRSDRLAGVFVEAARICATSTPGRVAKNVGSKSTDPEAIANALAKGFLPKLRKTAYKGCLSALG